MSPPNGGKASWRPVAASPRRDRLVAVLGFVSIACGARSQLEVEQRCIGGQSACSTDATAGAGGRAGAGGGTGGKGVAVTPPKPPAPPKPMDVPDSSVPRCVTPAPLDVFEPELQWSFAGDGEKSGSLVTPLVGNLTDDNADGQIDLLDTPDIVLVTNGAEGGLLQVLDGATGNLHFTVAGPVQTSTPALGDLDGDGIAEIVALDVALHVMIIRHDGFVMTGPVSGPRYLLAGSGSVTLANLDGQGPPEIIAGRTVFDAKGKMLWQANGADYSGAVAADLDGDGKLEVLFGSFAYRWDGRPYFDDAGSRNPSVDAINATSLVANMDGDQNPEVLVTTGGTDVILAQDGSAELRLPNQTLLGFPAFVADMDGDGTSDLGIPHGLTMDVVRTNGSRIFSASMDDPGGLAGATAFDFLGTGSALTLMVDGTAIHVWDSTGKELFRASGSTETAMQYPVVADIDNDGAAEFLVVAESPPILRAFRDKRDRWMPARRIWNQAAYHVTNVEENGTIPVHEEPYWKTHNTFRVQAPGCRLVSPGAVPVRPPP